MKKKLFLSLFALTASVFADGDVASPALADENLVAGDCQPKPKPPECKPKPPECKPKPKPCEPCVIAKVNPVVLTTARPCADNGFYFFADALYWYTDVGNNDWAVVNNNTEVGEFEGDGEHLQWKWNWGFRVGFGIDMDHDQWDTDFYYTWFQGKGSNSSDGSSVNLAAPAYAVDNVGDFGTFLTGSAEGKLNYDVLDWELGRWFYVSQSLTLRPHVGLRGAWLKLKQDESFTVSGGPVGTAMLVPVAVSDKTRFWAVGPTAGVNTSWWFGDANSHHWSIFGDFGGGILFGQLKEKFEAEGPTYEFEPKFRHVNTAIPVLNALMGLGWDTCFSCNKYHFGIRLGYELQVWFGAAQRINVDLDVLNAPTYTRVANNLSLQGMTLDFRFDF